MADLSLDDLRAELADWPARPVIPTEQAALLTARLGTPCSVDQLFPAWLATEAPHLAGPARDQQLTVLENMSVVQALEAGVEPRTVWNVLCDQMDVPDSKRWGKDHNAPPLPAR